MEGKLIKFSSKEEIMWTAKLDDRDMEILKDVLEAHLEYLHDTLKDCVVGDDLKIQYEGVKYPRMKDYLYRLIERISK